MSRIPYINDEENFTLKTLSGDLYEKISTVCGLVSDYCEIDQNDTALRETMMSLIDKSFENVLTISEKECNYYIEKFLVEQEVRQNLKALTNTPLKRSALLKKSILDENALMGYFTMMLDTIERSVAGLNADIQRIKANLQPFLAMKSIDQDTYGTTSQPVM